MNTRRLMGNNDVTFSHSRVASVSDKLCGATGRAAIAGSFALPMKSQNRFAKQLLAMGLIVFSLHLARVNAIAAVVTVHVAPGGTFTFSPATASIQVGDTVQWTWDSGGHSATSGTPDHPNGIFDSGVKNSGTFLHTFATAGDFPYYCTPHGSCCGMTALISVAATPTPTPSPTAIPTPTPSATPILPKIVDGVVRAELQTVASGLQAPIDLASPNDSSGRLFIVQQRGRVVILKDGLVLATPFLDVSARLVQFGDPKAVPGPNYDERGLLGLAFHPGFADPTSPGFRKFYTYTCEPVSGTADFTVPIAGSAFDHQGVLAEWQVSSANPDIADVSTRRELIRVDHPQFNHNGGQLAFRAGEPYLYLSQGDGGAANDIGPGHNASTGNGQDTTTVLGKILRIDPLAPTLTTSSADPVSANGNYRIPLSNPFVLSAGVPERVREIFAYGFRNPFRFSFDAPTNKLIVADVGQDHIEEIDLVDVGRNYGWHLKEGTFLFDQATGNVAPDPSPNPALTDPIAEYDHLNGIAVIGGFVYHGASVPALAGKYVFGDFSTAFATPDGHLFYLDNLSSSTIHELRIGNDDRAFGFYLKAMGRDAAGEVYALADSVLGPSGAGGRVMKLVSAPASPAVLNLSTRLRVQTGDNVLIGGFIVTGSASKRVAVRGLGPSLSINGQPIPGTVPNPLLELHDGTGALVQTNDDWQSGPDKQAVIDAGMAPPNGLESVVLATLAPGSYTGILRDAQGGSGIGLVELYDLDQAAPANAANIATRGLVQTGDDVMIGGFIIGGSVNRKVLVRAIGPSLTSAGVAGALQDPMLELHDGNGVLLLTNDNWKSTQQAEIEATGIPPADDRESALVDSLAPGGYTAIVRGANNTTGVALVEIYQLVP